MRRLLVSSTVFEVAPALEHLGISAPASGKAVPGTLLKGRDADCLVTGVGQMLCGIHLTRVVGTGQYNLALQAGLAGSFTQRFPKRSVVVVMREHLADLGAENNGTFLDLCEMGLLEKTEPPFVDGGIDAPEPPMSLFSSLPRVRSVTVNRVLSESASIAWIKERYGPDVVNMEGAAFFYVCRLFGVPFISVRAVSDFVGPRDKASWDIQGALVSLNEAVVRGLSDLSCNG
jgi:futalosine hydrolase